MSRLKVASAFFLLIVLAVFVAPVRGAEEAPAGTMILCDPGDPYYPLAEEIAGEEGLPVVHAWAEALEQDPQYIVWVVAPERLSDPVMVQAGLAQRKHSAALNEHSDLPVLGMITGSSMEQARALWERGKQRRQPETASRRQDEAASRRQDEAAKTTWLYAANGEHPSAGVTDAHLIAFGGPADGGPETQPLTIASLADALAQADYLAYTGHGGGRSLNLAEGKQFFTKNLPELPPVVVGTSACQTFRPWVKDSILIGFLDHGAAGYAGFVYSPMAGYLVGALDALPFRYTWPEFPIGRVVALQNQGTMQSFAAFPFYYLAGDPRMALSAQPPYQVLADSQQQGPRVISYSDVAAGLVPVYVSGGARYSYVEIPGVGSAANGDWFFNARVQVMDDQGDKFILFDHPGGPFSIRLWETPPWHWRVTRPLLDAFDDVVLFTPQNGGDVLVIAAGGVALGIGIWRYRRRRAEIKTGAKRLALECLAVGAATALALGIYAALRLGHAAINTKPLSISYTWLFGAGLCAAAGALLYASARGCLGKALAALAASFPALLPGLFLLGVMGGFNLLLAAPEIGAGIYGYRMALQALLAAGVMGVAFWGVFGKV